MVCPVPRSGRLGFVGDYTGAALTRFQRVRNWTFNPISRPEVRVYSGTRYGTQRIPAFLEAAGSFEGYGAVPPLFVGDEFTFIGYTAPTNGTPCTPGCAFTVLAVVESVNITWNWTAENRGVTWTVNFQSNENPSVVAAFDDPCDDEVFCSDNVCNLTFVLKNPCAGDAIVEFCNLVSASLTFTTTLASYSNSSTGCQVKKEAGNLDWTLEVVDQNPCIIPTINSDYLIELLATVSPATKWILKWGQFQGVSGFTVNTETNDMISKTNLWAMQAVNCCVPGTPVRGSIVDPAGTTLWPYATPI